MSLGDMPAYPIKLEYTNGSVYESFGMTIRQRYAMAAIQGILSDAGNLNSVIINIGPDDTQKGVATLAFSFADAMVKFEEDEREAKLRQEGKQKREAAKEAEGKEEEAIRDFLRNKKT